MNDVALFDSIFNSGLLDSFPGFSYRRQSSIPRADIAENKTGYTIEMDLPGHSEQDVSIELDHNVLTIAAKEEDAKKENAQNEKDTRYLVRERCVSSFSRSFTLPEDVQHDQISASFKNGILTVTIPRSEKKAPRTIAIEAA